MGKNSVALIGYRGAGKSAVGRALAGKLGWAFLDMDEALVAGFGMEIGKWVELHGWESFRQEEAKLLESLARSNRLVLATGGGVVLKGPNREALKRDFFVVWLQASSDVVHARLTGDSKSRGQRPSLTGLPLREEIESLLLERRPLYEETSDMALDTDFASPEGLASTIHERIAGDLRR